MTVRRGERWGSPVTVGASAVVVADDCSGSDLITRARRDGRDTPVVALAGGDLARTLGGGRPERVGVGASAVGAVVDLVRVEVDGAPPVWALAHVLAVPAARRSSWLRGELVAAMNAQFFTRRDLAPRAHPGDGLLDEVAVDRSMRPRARLAAWRRAVTGSHLPHPSIRVRRATHLTWEFDRPRSVLVDGRPIGRGQRVRLTVEADAVSVLA